MVVALFKKKVKMNENAKDLAVDFTMARKFRCGIQWNGYDVFIPVYRGNPVIGLPRVLLQKGEEARISTTDEAFEYLSYEMESKRKK